MRKHMIDLEHHQVTRFILESTLFQSKLLTLA